LFTRQIHLVKLKLFEAEKAFPQKGSSNGRKKSFASQIATPDFRAPSLVVSILRGNFGPTGNRWRT
jgi:hypothetical protein